MFWATENFGLQPCSVNGSERTTNFRAVVPFPNRHPARVHVGRRFSPLALTLTTNYWGIDAGAYNDVVNGVPSPNGTPYEWALISAGRPNAEGADSNCFARRGMWMFTRDPEPSQAVTDAIRVRATDLGLEVSRSCCRFSIPTVSTTRRKKYRKRNELMKMLKRNMIRRARATMFIVIPSYLLAPPCPKSRNFWQLKS